MEKNCKENLIRFSLSLIIAILIWAYVANMHNPIQTKTLTNVPIEVINSEHLISQNLAVDSKSLLSGSVVVEGRFSDIQNVSNDDIKVVANFKDLVLKEGTNTLPVTVSSNNTLLRINEKKTVYQAKININKLVKKDFVIDILTTGDLQEGYIIGTPVSNKSKVEVIGTKEELKNIDRINAVIDVSGATSDIKSKVVLTAIDKEGNVNEDIILVDNEVDVIVPVLYSKKVFIDLDIKQSVPKGKELKSYSLEKDYVTLIGRKQILDKIDTIKTEGIDLSRRYYDFDKKISLRIPEGVAIKEEIASVYASFTIE